MQQFTFLQLCQFNYNLQSQVNCRVRPLRLCVQNWLRHIWSRTHLIPGIPVPQLIPLDKRSPDPQKFGPPGLMIPNQFGPRISGYP